VPYLNCPNCRLTVYSSPTYSSPEHCPRCEARLGEVRRLFMSPLPGRLMPLSGSAPRRPLKSPVPPAAA
jgi:hypothetical protein